jgi:bilin biosynthesis protein
MLNSNLQPDSVLLLLAQTEIDALLETVNEQITLLTFDSSDQRILRQLVESFADPRGMVRLRLAETLGEIGEPATPFLLEALANHPNLVVRRAAAKTLAIIADPIAIPTLLHAFLSDEDIVVQGSAIGALARIGEAAVPVLLDILAASEYSESTKGYAAWAVAFIGPEAADQLYPALSSDSADVRCAAVSAIAHIAKDQGTERAFKLLLSALTDSDASVRTEAAASLGRFVYAPALPHLILALQDVSGDVRKAAVSSLGRIGDGMALEPLQAALNDELEVVRSLAKLAISQINSVTPLTNLAMSYSLNSKAQSGNDPLLLAQAETDALILTVNQQQTQGTFIPDDEQILKQLVESFSDSRGMVRLRIAETLGEIGSPATPCLLEGLAHHPNPVVRRACAKTLTLIADPNAIPTLLHALFNDEDTVVKGSAVGALARIGEPAVPPLLEILASPKHPESTKGHAAWALAFIGTAAKEHLYQALSSDSEEVRAAVIGAIAKVAQDDPQEGVFEILLDALTDPAEDVRSEAAAALGNLTYLPAIPKLVELLHHSALGSRRAAALALMKMGRPALDSLRSAQTEEPEAAVQQVLKLAISQIERREEEV